MVQIGEHENPITFTRTHTAKNIGNSTFSEVLYESKTKCVIIKDEYSHTDL